MRIRGAVRVVVVALVALVALVPTGLPAGQAAAITSPLPVPNGYRVTNRQDISSGLTYVQYQSTNPRRVINIAYLRRNATEHFRTVLSNEQVAGNSPRTETLSSMCRRVSCKIAINGDFFSRASSEPAGGMATDGYAYRTPPDARYHFVEDWSGNVAVRKITMPIRLNVTYPNGVRSYVVNSINTDRDANRSAIYSPKWGPATGTSTSGYELTLQATTQVKMDSTIKVTIKAGRAGGNTAIPSNGFVLSGNGGYATDYANLWNSIKAGGASAQAELVMDSQPNLRMFVGGTPALLQGGQQAFTNDGSALVNTSDPHTFVGRNSNGDAILVVVDGRQPSWSTGMNLIQGTQFMRSLGCIEALNLDGGGSSEFVKNGTVTDRPSDGQERPLAAALAIVS